MRALAILSLVAALATPNPASAQSTDTQTLPTVDDLKIPSAAAAALLDIAPTSVERPDTPRALVVNLISHVAKDDGVPKNFAVQVTPYWLAWHPGLTFDSYINPSLWQRIVRSLAVSLASADWTVGSGQNKTDLGSRTAIGASTIPLQGRIDRRIMDFRDELIEVTRSIGVELRAESSADADLRRYRAGLAAALAGETDPARIVQRSRELADADAALAARAAARREKLTRLEQRSRTLARDIQAFEADREGLRLAVAAAWSWGIPADVFGDARRERSAVWVTPSYRLSGAEGSSLEFIGVGRFIRDTAAARAIDALDFGARLAWQARKEIGLSAEVVRRQWRQPEVPDTYRAAGIFEARLGSHAYFFAAFGRDYEQRRTRSTLLSVVGINVGFGRKPALTF